jgi:hypothetical protein
MKAGDFKKMIKEAVREVFQEEMREILIEAVRSPKVPVGVAGYGTVAETAKPTPGLNESSRAVYRDMMKGMFDQNGTATFTTAQTPPAYTPPPISTTGEGSALPAGEVNLDQIMGLMTR